MPTPEFILELRKKVGHELLWLSGVSAVVFNDDGEVLLVRRRDTGRWALVGGILEPGEQPAQAIVREVLEETGVQVAVERLSSCWAGDPMVIPTNGDEVQFLDLTFRCRYVGGAARVADEENSAVGWYRLDALPSLKDSHYQRIEHAKGLAGEPFFIT